MTTYTTQGFSRVINYETSTYTDFQPASLELVREDGDNSFLYHYGWVDESGQAPKFAQIDDLWSHTATMTRNGADPVDLRSYEVFTEKQVYQVTWEPGKTAYVLGIFQPAEGIETIFFIGGDLPVITDLISLSAFMALPQDYILEGPFEGGQAIPLDSFANQAITQDDHVVALSGVSLHWDAGAGNDTVLGGTADDVLVGGSGNDWMTSGGGSDTLWGGLGNDTLHGGGNFTNMMGGAGNDVLHGASEFGENQEGGSGDDLIMMSNGQDFGGGNWVSHSHANGGSGRDTITGGLAGDVASGGNGADLMNGNQGDDWFSGGNGNDTVNGDAGSDNLSGGLGNDSLVGGDGNDVLDGGGNDDIASGGEGNDNLIGGDGNDKLYGGNLADTLSGDAGNDTLFGDNGIDSLSGGLGADQLNGGAGDDYLDGGDGKDLLKGDAGADFILGGAAADTLQGGASADEMDGGFGADQFRYLLASDSTNSARDQIFSFEVGSDKIDLSRVDANSGLGGTQDFVFIGSDAFTAAGQVRLSVSPTDTVIEVNTAGADGAEMAIVLLGVTTLSAGDIIL